MPEADGRRAGRARRRARLDRRDRGARVTRRRATAVVACGSRARRAADLRARRPDDRPRRGLPRLGRRGPRVPRLRRRDRRRRARAPAPRRHRRRRTRSSTGSGTRRTSTGRSRCSASPGSSPSASAARRRSSATPAPRRTRRRSRSRARRPGRSRIVALEGGFHGRTLGALSATGQPAKWEGFGPLVPGVSFARPNDVESLEAAVAPGGELAAIMLEPVLGEGGVLPLEEGFVQAAAEIAREVGALLCVDEVQAGLGRTGTFFAYEQLGHRAGPRDAREGARQRASRSARSSSATGVADAIGPGDHGSTFGGNPVACAAACAVVEAIDDALLENVAARGEQLARRVSPSSPACSRCAAAACSSPACSTATRAPVVDECRARGLLALTAGARRAPPAAAARRHGGRGRRGARRPPRGALREERRPAAGDPPSRARPGDLDAGGARRRAPRGGPRRRADDDLARRPRARAHEGARPVRPTRLRGARRGRRRPAPRDRRRDAPLCDAASSRPGRSSSSRLRRATRARSPRRSTRAGTRASRARSPATTRSSSPRATGRAPTTSRELGAHLAARRRGAARTRCARSDAFELPRRRGIALDGFAAAKPTPSGICPAVGGDRAAGIRFCGFLLANKKVRRPLGGAAASVMLGRVGAIYDRRRPCGALTPSFE